MNERVDLSQAREVCPTTTRRLIAEGALMVDVRELSEVAQVAFDVPGVLLMPLSELEQRFAELPRDRDLVLVCREGDRSLKATYFLMYQGYERVANMEGGLYKWARKGFPIKGAQPAPAATAALQLRCARQRPLLLSEIQAMTPRTLGLALAGVLAVGIGLGTAVVTLSGPATTTAAAPAEDAVQQALRAGKPTVAEFGANACASCREMKPVLEALRRVHGERIAVVEVDLIAQRQMGYIQRYRIQLMPTQVFFDAQGRETGRHMGTISGAEILARLEGGVQ